MTIQWNRLFIENIPWESPKVELNSCSFKAFYEGIWINYLSNVYFLKVWLSQNYSVDKHFGHNICYHFG